MPKDIEKAVDVLEAGCVSPQDVVRVSLLDQGEAPHDRAVAMSYMMNIGGIGIDARVCEMVNAKKKQGQKKKAF